MITQKQVKDLFTYYCGVLIWNLPRAGVTVGKSTGYVDKLGYMCTGVNGKVYKTHRLIFLYHHGYLPKEVDHKDGNPLNNKIENLRECSRSENIRNKKIR